MVSSKEDRPMSCILGRNLVFFWYAWLSNCANSSKF